MEDLGFCLGTDNGMMGDLMTCSCGGDWRLVGTVPYLSGTEYSGVVLDKGGRTRGSVLPDEGTTEDLELCLGTQDWAFGGTVLVWSATEDLGACLGTEHGKRGGLGLESKVFGTLSICFRTRAGMAHDLVL